ncbi:MAG: prepilin-type N-terminal cleavage/methylation domain-containing protein [Verrucomicrobiales bacterium]
MSVLPPSHVRSVRKSPRRGFTLIEVSLAVAIFATVLLGMLALLANGVSTRAQVRRDTIGVHLCQQIHQALRGYRKGIDDIQPAAPGGIPGLLDEFLPFDFAQFPGAGKPAFVLGFDSEGKPRGKNLSGDYQSGTLQDGVRYLATIEGKPVVGKTGLTEVLVGIEFPAGESKKGRKRQEFRVLMTPRAVEATKPGGTP